MAIQTRCWQVFGLVAAMGAAWLTASAQASQSILELEDGRQIQGRVLSDNAKEVVVDIAGVQTVFPRDQVKAIRQVKSVEQQFRERRAAIANDDLAARYELARWLLENRAYALARQEVEALIDQFPNDGRLPPLQTLIDARLKLLEAPAASQDKSRPAAARGPAGQRQREGQSEPAAEGAAASASAANKDDFDHHAPADRLTDKAVQLIRVYEVDLKAKPSVHVPNEVMEEVFKRYAGEPDVPADAQAQRRFLGQDGWRKLDLLFKLRAREQYEKVVVHHDPPALAEFRTNLHNRYVQTYCATNACHGGKEAGDLYLFRYQPASNETVYTNYYILHQYVNTAGYMVDRQKPDRSLLVHYGLPRAATRTPHPDVPGWRPLFRDMNDPRAQQIVKWVQRLGMPSSPYPVSYAIPKMPKPPKPAQADAADKPAATETPAGEASADKPAQTPKPAGQP